MIRPSARASVCTLVVLMVVLNTAIALSQVVTGAILGRVTATTGAVVPGAAVQIQNLDTGFSQSVQSDSGGRYLSRNLPLGSYSVTVHRDGFQTLVRRGIVLTVASEVVVNAELVVGAVQETVEVTAEAPMVETTNATVSSLVGQGEIRDLPLNGRNIDTLALLAPGTFQNTAVSNTQIQGQGMRLSVNGARPDANLYLLDGTVVNDHAVNGPNSATGANLGVEGILEFRVLTHNFSAEYGRNSGAVLSMVTRSGTNQFHGSAYEFVRNNIFDARNFFNPGALPAYRRNQFGAALGGRIIKDRMFFFVNYEGLRRRQGRSFLAAVPDADARRGIVRGQSVTLNSFATPYVNLYPLPNGRNFGDGTGELTTNVSSMGTEDYAMERMDFRISDKDNFYWRYVYNPSEALTPLTVPIFNSQVRTTMHFLALSETHIFSGNSLNEFRFGFNRSEPLDITAEAIPIDHSLEFIPGQGMGRVRFAGTAGDGASGLTEIGSTRQSQFFVQNLFQATDTVSVVRGRHSLKFGGDFERIQLNIRWGDPRGEYRFGGLVDLLAGRPSRFEASLVDETHSDRRGWRRRTFGWFIQDDFHLGPNLTLNLGLRHEFFTDPTEVHDRRGNLINPTDPRMTPGPPFETKKANFSPRFGLAWDPTGSGKTSVRFGAGMFFNHLDGRNWWRTAAFNADYLRSVRVDNPPFPKPFSQGFNLGVGATGRFDVPLDTPTVVHYNLELQRELSPTLNLRAAYVGSYGYNMIRPGDSNTRIPTICRSGLPVACAGSPDGTKYYPSDAPKPNPNFTDIDRIASDAEYNYNGLQLVLQKTFSGLRVAAAYTYSKALSNDDLITGSQTAATADNIQDPADLDAEYSLSAYDQRQTLVFSGKYDMPWDRRLNGGVAKAVLGGWSTNWIYSYGSGLPFNMGLLFQNSRSGAPKVNDRPNLIPGFSNNPISGATAGCGHRDSAGREIIDISPGPLHTADRWYDPCAFALAPLGFFGNLGRNTVTAPGINKVDFTIMKDTRLAEQKSLEFRAEFFNLFNHAQFALPNRLIFDSSRLHSGNDGRITSTASNNREIQFGLKLIF